MRSRRYQEALAAIEEALNDSPEDGWLLREQADALLRLGDTHRAGSVLKRLLSGPDPHPRVYTLAGERHRLEGRCEDATQSYLTSLRLREDPYVRTRVIDGLLQLERFPEASEAIELGLQLRTDDPYLLRRKARLLASSDQKAAAADTFARTAQLSHEDHPRDYANALKLRLEALPLDQRLKELRAITGVSTHRNNAYLHAMLAEVLLELKDQPAAETALREAQLRADEDPFALKTIGFLYNRLHLYPDVLNTLGRAFVKEPRDIIAQQVLLAAAKKSHQLAALRTLFVLAYEAHPGFHKLNGLIRKLDKAIEQAPDEPAP